MLNKFHFFNKLKNRIEFTKDSKFELKYFESILENWNLNPLKIVELSGGKAKSNWLLETSDSEKYVLQNVGSDKKWLTWVFFIIKKLTESNFSYSYPHLCVSNNNEIFVEHQGTFWWLYKFVEGNTSGFFIPSNISAYEVGLLVAQYHKVISDIDCHEFQEFQDYQLILFDTKNIEAGIQYLNTSKANAININEKAYLIDTINHFFTAYNQISTLERQQIEQLRKIPIYYDFHGNNILSIDGKITGLIDFDSLAIGARIIDIQNALFYIASTDTGINIFRVKSFMEGYCSILKVLPNELTLVYPVMIERTLVLLLRFLKDKDITGKSFLEKNDYYVSRLISVLNWLIDNKKAFFDCILDAI